MYRDKIRNLEKIVEDQTHKIDMMRDNPNKNHQEFMALNEQRSMNLRELSRLRRLEYDDSQRVNFDDDR